MKSIQENSKFNFYNKDIDTQNFEITAETIKASRIILMEMAKNDFLTVSPKVWDEYGLKKQNYTKLIVKVWRILLRTYREDITVKELERYRDAVYSNIEKIFLDLGLRETSLEWEEWLKNCLNVRYKVDSQTGLIKMRYTNKNKFIQKVCKVLYLTMINSTNIDTIALEEMGGCKLPKQDSQANLLAETANQSKDPRKKLYIFTSLATVSCNTQNHDVREVYIPLFSTIEKHYIDVPAHKCRTCKRTFISEEMWRLYMKHGIEHAYYVQEETDYDAFRKESQLHSLGYRVGANGMDVYERQLFLMGVLNKKQMTLFEIERDITNAINIHRNNSRMYDSVSDWKDDLKFLGDYVLKQRR